MLCMLRSQQECQQAPVSGCGECFLLLSLVSFTSCNIVTQCIAVELAACTDAIGEHEIQ